MLKKFIFIWIMFLPLLGIAQKQGLDTIDLEKLIIIETLTKNGIVSYITDDYKNPPYTGYAISSHFPPPNRYYLFEEGDIRFFYTGELYLYKDGKCIEVNYYRRDDGKCSLRNPKDTLVYTYEIKRRNDKIIKKGILFYWDCWNGSSIDEKIISQVKNHKYHGKILTYRNDMLYIEEKYKNGLLHGISKIYYYENGMVYFKEKFKNGLLHGISKSYNEEGKLVYKAKYKEGELIKIFFDRRVPATSEGDY